MKDQEGANLHPFFTSTPLFCASALQFLILPENNRRCDPFDLAFVRAGIDPLLFNNVCDVRYHVWPKSERKFQVLSRCKGEAKQQNMVQIGNDAKKSHFWRLRSQMQWVDFKLNVHLIKQRCNNYNKWCRIWGGFEMSLKIKTIWTCSLIHIIWPLKNIFLSSHISCKVKHEP